MRTPFSSSIETRPDHVLIKMAGDISEEVQTLPPVPPSPSSIVLDVGQVTAINSIGIRLWCAWMKDLSSRAQTWKSVPRSFVVQMNMVSGFMPPTVTVESVLVPYHCDNCDAFHEEVVACKIVNDDGIPPLPELKCKNDGAELFPDLVPKRYFAFLKKRTS